MIALRALFIAVLALAIVGASDRYPGTTVIGKMIAQVDPDAPLAGVQVFLRGGLDRQTTSQNGYAALLAEVIARTPVAVDGAQQPLREAIANLGANLVVTLEPQDVRYYVEGRPASVAAGLALLASALAGPDFSSKTLTAAKSALRARIDDADQSPYTVVASMLRSSYYLGSAAGYAPAGSPAVIANTDADNLKRFWAANYRRGGAGLSAAGRIDENLARAAQSAVDRLPDGEIPGVLLRAKPPSDPPARIVTHRDVGLPWVGIGFPAPSAGAKDFAAMLVIQSVISSLGVGEGITSRPAALRPINTVYQFDVRPANFIVYSSGDALGTSSGIREIFAVTELLASKALDSRVVERYRRLASGTFVIDNMTLEDRSALLGVFARQGLDPDYPNQVLAAIDAVNAADIQRVAKAYLQKYTVAVVLPRATRPSSR